MRREIDGATAENDPQKGGEGGRHAAVATPKRGEFEVTIMGDDFDFVRRMRRT